MKIIFSIALLIFGSCKGQKINNINFANTSTIKGEVISDGNTRTIKANVIFNKAQSDSIKFLYNEITALKNALSKVQSGTAGATGAQGIQGVQGIQGLRGENGAKGDKGDTGNKGDLGGKGDKGDIGSKGDAGMKGDKGDIGATGAPGSSVVNNTISDSLKKSYLWLGLVDASVKTLQANPDLSTTINSLNNTVTSLQTRVSGDITNLKTSILINTDSLIKVYSWLRVLETGFNKLPIKADTSTVNAISRSLNGVKTLANTLKARGDSVIYFKGFRGDGKTAATAFEDIEP